MMTRPKRLALTALVCGIAVCALVMLKNMAINHEIATPRPIARPGWLDFSPPGAACSVCMPPSPEALDQTRADATTGVSVCAHTFTSWDNGHSFTLSYCEYPKSVTDEFDSRQILLMMRVGVVGSSALPPAVDRVISVEGCPGGEVAYDDSAKGMRRVCRFFVSGSRGYVLGVTSPLARPDSAMIDRFFSSFHLATPATSHAARMPVVDP